MLGSGVFNIDAHLRIHKASQRNLVGVEAVENSKPLYSSCAVST